MHKGTQLVCFIAILMLLATSWGGIEARSFHGRDFQDLLEALDNNLEQRASCNNGCSCRRAGIFSPYFCATVGRGGTGPLSSGTSYYICAAGCCSGC
ncbi:unnamed protein product [Adineta ricciae]|uniref:Uncharacterized protein n=1 Tax=Adineta ricciae TaxID=249248 RepID=A0A816BR73_ADIRI|nr:unnamed protein product [Adineta ricciae]